MAEVIETEFGMLLLVNQGSGQVWKLKCPGCGVWGELDDDQFHGRVSVDHDADGCPGHYHETHDFAAAVAR